MPMYETYCMLCGLRETNYEESPSDFCPRCQCKSLISDEKHLTPEQKLSSLDDMCSYCSKNYIYLCSKCPVKKYRKELT
jgi:dihydroxyacetone kinase-like predicted kinase